MPVRPPSLNELRAIATRHGLGLSDEDLEEFRELILEVLPAYEVVEELTPPTPEPSGTRSVDPNPPAPAENPLNAWSWRCHITQDGIGPLAGKRVAIKDNTAVAGVPMKNGSSLLDDYVPDFDATVVARVLDSGGTIVGKTACEDLCLSGGSHTCRTGPLRNPHDPSRAAGGSSGGSAAVLVLGEADLALGGDQGGSVRIPASWCGVVGLKPTRGLVPYTGAFAIEITFDHLGPMARTVTDVATFLDAIAGVDGLDPRQPQAVPAQRFSVLDADADAATGSLRIGVIEEGFEWTHLSEKSSDDAVRAALEVLDGGDDGIDVTALSVPMHRQGIDIWAVIANEGAADLMIKGNGFGTNHDGAYATHLMAAFGAARRDQGAELSETVKRTLLLGEYLHEEYYGVYYGMAKNLVPTLTAAYDAALEHFDVIAMPTVPMRAPVLPSADASRTEIVRRAQYMLCNAAPFNITGHPAITIPCGTVDGLPVGLMLVGRRWEDAALLRAAKVLEDRLSRDGH